MVANGANASPGDVIAGRYRIEGWVGQGAMAMVFRATHLGTGRPCALKLVHAHLVERPEIQEMFIQEARVGGRIGKNQYIVDVFDAGIDSERRVPFLAMDLLEGTTLDKYIKEYGQMPSGLLKTLWLQAAEALEQAHAAGVVHRDLKPGNLFLTYDRKGNPQLRIVDFGIAKLMEEGIQRTATQIGSPAYAAPEQLGNGMRMMADRMGYKISASISPATDIWSIGIVTYEMLVGAPPGQLWTGLERGTGTDLLVLVATGPIPSATARAGSKGILLPPGFDAWLEKCLQKNAADRWPSIELAVQNLISLFDENSNRLGTLKLPPISVLNDVRPQTANSTLILPKIVKSDSERSEIKATSDEIRRSSSQPLHRSSISDTNSSDFPAPQIDGTNMGVAETLTPKRAKRVRHIGILIMAFIGIALISIFGWGAVFSKKEVAKQELLPIASVTAAITPAQIIVVEPKTEEDPAIRAPAPAPNLPSAAPTASLWGRLPSPKASSSAAIPEATAAPAPIPNVAMTNEGTGTLNINSIPVSKIIVNGKPMGSTPKLGVSVSAGSYTVVFIHPEKGKKSASGTIKAGETKTAAVKF